MPRSYKQGVIVTSEVIAELTGGSLNAVHQATRRVPSRKRQKLDINSLESVVLWIAAHGRRELRQKIAALAAQSFISPAAGAPKKSRK